MHKRDDQCIGGDGGQGYPDGCPHPPLFFAGGDPSCHYHLVKVVRMRLEEVGHDIQVGHFVVESDVSTQETT